jgi:phosphopentomutase
MPTPDLSHRRVVVVVVDGFGVGPAPDALRFGPYLAHTARSVATAADAVGIPLEVLRSWGLGNYLGRPTTPGVSTVSTAATWSLVPSSAGCDTPTGHWELMGCATDVAPPTFPDGFDAGFLARLAADAKVDGWLGNCVASGVAVIARYGAEHCAGGRPIVYTSADSVLQIAACEEHFGLERLWQVCASVRTTADSLAAGARTAAVGRVIARPFVHTPEGLHRSNNRRDWAVPPPRPTVLDVASEAGVPVTTIGKIGDIFDHRGCGDELHPAGDAACWVATVDAVADTPGGLVFTNLVEFDTRYGHPRDPVGYARHLGWLDANLPRVADLLRPGDRLVITADHGNDPRAPGSDHTRECVPAIVWGPDLAVRGWQGAAPMGSLGAAVLAAFGLDPAAIDPPPGGVTL